MNELALFVRVHLLEAICNYLRGNNERASDALNKVRILIMYNQYAYLLTLDGISLAKTERRF